MHEHLNKQTTRHTHNMCICHTTHKTQRNGALPCHIHYYMQTYIICASMHTYTYTHLCMYICTDIDLLTHIGTHIHTPSIPPCHTVLINIHNFIISRLSVRSNNCIHQKYFNSICKILIMAVHIQHKILH